MTTRFNISQAARVVRRGGIVAYPTEGVYGLGCRPDRESAIQRLMDMKGRPATAGFILISADLKQLTGWIAPSEQESRLLDNPVDTPVTWIVSAGPAAHPLLTGNRPTIAVRITGHPVAAALCRTAACPLISTSANRSGQAPARRALEVRMRSGLAPDFVLSGQVGRLSGPTEIRVAATGQVLRPGPDSDSQAN